MIILFEGGRGAFLASEGPQIRKCSVFISADPDC